MKFTKDDLLDSMGLNIGDTIVIDEEEWKVRHGNNPSVYIHTPDGIKFLLNDDYLFGLCSVKNEAEGYVVMKSLIDVINCEEEYEVKRCSPKN